ncbi:antibiotic biosynthesis monooxygenase [Streptomyces cinnamoneus]|uniref:putative quinol monooxygenase n=1 Tax=Streptomyces cinnamoneus TaxID=53446 RepID=UPI0033E06EFC
MARHAFHAKFTAHPGRGEDLARRFLEVAEALREFDECELFAVTAPSGEEDAVWVTEAWSDPEAHSAALADERIAAITRHLPALLAAAPERIDLRPLGGKGLRG